MQKEKDPASETEAVAEEVSDADRAAAELEKCREIAGHRSILNLFSESLQRSGYAGSTTVAELIYLGCTSRLLSKPVSMVAKASSSAGKSFTIERTLDYFEDEAYFRLSASSEKALIYTKESFRHRVLYVPEAEGLGGEQMQSLIRGLLSEGRIDYEYTLFNKGDDPRTERIPKEGPTSLLVGTTRFKLHPEVETRLLSLPINDSPAQTRMVLQAIATEAEFEPQDLAPWLAFQRFLAIETPFVTVPFAPTVAELASADSVRMRRDFASFLGLVRAHALMHRLDREVVDGKLVANLEDYAQVCVRVNDFISVTNEESVPLIVRETVNAVDELTDDMDLGVGIPDLAMKLGVNVSTARRRAYHAISTGFLTNLAGGRHRPMRLLAEPMPNSDSTALPTIEELLDALSAKDREAQGHVE